MVMRWRRGGATRVWDGGGRPPHTSRPYMIRPYTSKGLYRHRHALDDLAQHLFGLFGFFQGGSVERTYHHAVGKDGDDEGLEIFGSAVIAALEEGHGLGGAVEHLRASRGYSERKILGLARLAHYVQQVRDERFVHMDLGYGLLDFDYVGGAEHGAQVVELGSAGFGAQDLALGVAFGISHANPHQETIELRLGQRISAVVLAGILCGDDQKRLRERIGMRVDGDLPLIHGLEQGGLRLRSGAVDFVG